MLFLKVFLLMIWPVHALRRRTGRLHENKFEKLFVGENFEENCRSASSTQDVNWQQERQVEEFVNILGGSNSNHFISHGSTLPLITRPWGFNSYAPHTDDDSSKNGRWWFQPQNSRFFGIRVTHQPSPWISDYGQFLMKAYMPTQIEDTTAGQDRYIGYSPTQSEWHPYYFATTLFGYGNSAGRVKMELTPTSHGGMMRVTFPKYIENEVHDDANPGRTLQVRRVSLATMTSNPGTSSYGDGENHLEIGFSPIDGTAMLSGSTSINNGGVGNLTGTNEAGFAHYFVFAIYNGKTGDQVVRSYEPTSVANVSIQQSWIDLSPENPDNDVLTIRFATSFISKEQALYNLQVELPVENFSFEDLLKEAQLEWRSVLSRIRITEPPLGYDSCQLKSFYSVFYTSLYRASIFPRQLSEPNMHPQDHRNSAVVHWSPYATSVNDRVKGGALSTDSGFWDAWNTVYPLLSLFHRPMLGTTIQGWLNAFEEGGWLPKWASPGYRSSMVGTMGDVSLADAIVNDIPQFNVSQAYAAIRKDAFEIPPSNIEGIGRECLDYYFKYGLIPRGATMVNAKGVTIDCTEVVARSLNYYHSDYAVAQAALKLGKTADAEALAKRATQFSLSFDNKTGFFRSKDVNNLDLWTTPFDQYSWGGDYTEGGPYQYRFYVPYDPQGLAKLYQESGRDMCAELEYVQAEALPLFHIGGYSSEIHEERELPDHCWGQYAHNNQPSHHMLYMHMFDGYGGSCSNQGRYWIREVQTSLYQANVNMFPGDEDNGEMGAWFVLSALGLYQRSPGSGQFELGIPLFGRVEIDISDIPHSNTQRSNEIGEKQSEKRILTIVAQNNSYENSFVEKVFWNGKEIPKSLDSIPYAALAQGGILTFQLGPHPN